MKRHALLKHLKKCGCEFYKEGKKHTIWLNPTNGMISPVPRHTEIKDTLAHAICSDLGVDKPGR